MIAVTDARRTSVGLLGTAQPGTRTTITIFAMSPPPPTILRSGYARGPVAITAADLNELKWFVPIPARSHDRLPHLGGLAPWRITKRVESWRRRVNQPMVAARAFAHKQSERFLGVAPFSESAQAPVRTWLREKLADTAQWYLAECDNGVRLAIARHIPRQGPDAQVRHRAFVSPPTSPGEMPQWRAVKFATAAELSVIAFAVPAGKTTSRKQGYHSIDDVAQAMNEQLRSNPELADAIAESDSTDARIDSSPRDSLESVNALDFERDKPASTVGPIDSSTLPWLDESMFRRRPVTDPRKTAWPHVPASRQNAARR